MAKIGDAGIGEDGNFVKVKEHMIAENRVFEIVGASIKAAQGKFKEGVNFHIRFLDVPAVEADKVYTFTLSNNEVRQRYVEYFADNGSWNDVSDEPMNAEPLRGVKYERGLVCYFGTGGQGGNPPVLFRDATEDEAANVRALESHDDDIPF